MKRTPYIKYIIEDVITNMDNTLTVTSVSGNDIVVDCLKYVKLFNTLLVDRGGGVIDAVTMTAIDTATKTITLSAPIGSYVSVSLPSVFYFAGTRYATNKEWIQASDREVDKLPLIWLTLSPNPTEEYVNETSLLPYVSIWRGVNVLFLDNFDSLNWITEDKIEERVKPLRELCYWFKKSVLSLVYSYEFDGDYNEQSYPTFGTVSEAGIEKRILDSDLTAVALTFDLKVKQTCNLCDCN